MHIPHLSVGPQKLVVRAQILHYLFIYYYYLLSSNSTILAPVENRISSACSGKQVSGRQYDRSADVSGQVTSTQETNDVHSDVSSVTVVYA